MHLTRKESSTKLPIPRKGTKYIARALSHIQDSVPVVLAVRDMLKLAKTAREVRKMIQAGILKINGRPVRDYRESIKLFNIFEAGKKYELSLLPTKKFTLNEISKDERLCKVINKILLPQKKVQLNLHDGSNLISKEKVNVGDSIYLDFSGKISRHVPLQKGSSVFILSGKYSGQDGKLQALEPGKVSVKLKTHEAVLNKNQVVAR